MQLDLFGLRRTVAILPQYSVKSYENTSIRCPQSQGRLLDGIERGRQVVQYFRHVVVVKATVVTLARNRIPGVCIFRCDRGSRHTSEAVMELCV